MPRIKINEKFCKGCMLCIPVCAHDALEASKMLNA
ncbi:MAG: 4Fe-4S binding protein [Candidatus Anammoxibacter sp.]